MSENSIWTGAGGWQVHLGRRELLSNGVPVPIGSRAFEIIEMLVRSANELVTKDDLMDRVWPGAMVGENALHVHISAIRKALGQDRTMLKTASGRGYRLLGNWTPGQPDPAGAPIASLPMSEPEPPSTRDFPLVIGRLIGRGAALRHVRDLVSAYRVVTLTGPGGIGKTVLAIQAARGLLANFGGGGWFVELGSLADPDLVPLAVAKTLGPRLSGAISAEAVARAVGSKRLLVVLDNCEHVIEAAANLVEQFTRMCPRVTLLVTSREVLRIDGEAVYRVPPLDVPALGVPALDVPVLDVPVLDVAVLDASAHDVPAIDVFTRDVPTIDVPARGVPALDVPAHDVAALGVPTFGVASLGREAPDRVRGYSAVELFIARLNALDEGRTPRAEELASVAAICCHLDGIPLAIEFAAARAATLGIEPVARGLRDRFALLKTARRTALPRHRTLRATLDWSYELLPDAERRLLQRLAIFAGSFSLEAVGVWQRSSDATGQRT